MKHSLAASNNKTMKSHEYANIFPMMSDVEIARLAEDIKERGLLDPIITLDGKILDGRNRFKACQVGDTEPRFNEYSGDDPLAFVISHNLHRRHLDESQRGMVAAKLANMKEGRPETSPNGLVKVTQKQAAEMLNVGVNTLKRAKKAIDDGIPELADMVASGEIKASTASDVAKLPEEEQRKAVSGGVAGVKAAAKSAPKKQSAKKLPTNDEIIREHQRILGNLKAAWSVAPPSIRDEFISWVEKTRNTTQA